MPRPWMGLGHTLAKHWPTNASLCFGCFHLTIPPSAILG
jgi:hypothetical protein